MPTHISTINDPLRTDRVIYQLSTRYKSCRLSEKGISLEAWAMVNNQKAIYCEDKDVYLIIIRPRSVH